MGLSGGSWRKDTDYDVEMTDYDGNRVPTQQYPCGMFRRVSGRVRSGDGFGSDGVGAAELGEEDAGEDEGAAEELAGAEALVEEEQ